MASGEELQPAAVQDLLDQIVARTVAGMGAHAGALFLLEPGGEVLLLDASTGMPTGFVSLLRRMRVASVADGPLAEAILQRHPVWVGSGAEFARRYPRLALTFPFVGAVAAAPLVAGSRVWGAMLVLFSQKSPAPDARAQGRLTTAARCIALLLQDAAEAGHPSQPGPAARLLPPTPGPARRVRARPGASPGPGPGRGSPTNPRPGPAAPHPPHARMRTLASKLRRCGRYPTAALRSPGAAPSTRTSPTAAGRIPSRTLTRVDFPTPLGPSMAVNSPAPTVRSTPDHRVRPPTRTAAPRNDSTGTRSSPAFKARAEAPRKHFAVGDRVPHDTYGLGRAIGVERDIVVLVDFGSRQERITQPYTGMFKL